MTNSIGNPSANPLSTTRAPNDDKDITDFSALARGGKIDQINTVPPPARDKDNASVASLLPNLSEAQTLPLSADAFVGIPSMGASMMALMTEFSAEQRKQNANQRALQTEMIVDTILDQAKTMKNKAIVQLCIGVASGALSIAQGVISGNIMKKGTAANANIKNDAAKQTADMLLNTKNQMINSSMGGVVQTMGSINQAVGGFMDAELKKSDAKIEQLRAMSDTLQSLEESFKELIQKSLSTQDAIQQNTNQARTKILG